MHCNRIISGQELVCELCFDQINFTHWQNGNLNILLEKCSVLFPVEEAFALMHFDEEGLSRKIIHALKYKNREKIGQFIGQWTAERLTFSEHKPDLIVTIPLHPKKQRERGYNQLHLFAKTISEHLQIPVNNDFLKRTRYKKAQALQDKAHRAETANLFELNSSESGKHILLVDDVFTTGNTISAAVWEILKNPGNRVSILVIAVD